MIAKTYEIFLDVNMTFKYFCFQEKWLPEDEEKKYNSLANKCMLYINDNKNKNTVYCKLLTLHILSYKGCINV
jgi:hypothetical protein